MSNEEYQRLLRSPAGELRERLPGDGARAPRDRAADRRARRRRDRGARSRDLGGHDLADLLDAFRRADAVARPPRGHLRVHDQGRGAADAGASGQPLRAACRTSSGRSSPSELGADTADPWAPFAAGHAEAELCRSAAERLAARRRSRSAGRAPSRATSGACTPAARRPSRRSGASSSTSRARRPGGREARRHRLARRRLVDEPRRLDQPRRRLEHGRAHRLVRRRHRHARALARVVARPAHRARHRRGEPRRPARRARRDLVARRPAAAADRRALRPVRQPRARAVVVRDLRGRPVDPRRHAVGRHARARGRRAPVDHHAVGRARAAALRRLGAGVRPGPRVDAARGAREPRPQRRHLGVLPAQHAARRPDARRRCPTTPTRASSAAARCSPAAISCASPSRPPDVVARRHGRRARRRARARPTSSRPAASAVDVVCLTSADLVFRALQARQGLMAGDDGDPRRALPAGAPRADRDRARRPSRTRSRSSRPSAACRSRASASTTSASRATSRTSTPHFGIDTETIIGAALDLTADA